jgi:glycosyltransferase involved in cell wall biosynthesis
MKPPLGASVVVCTRNRGELVLGTCAAALGLEAPEGGYEVLVVDNGSTDGSLEEMQEVARRHPGRMRVVEEPTPGLSRARNLGLREARGELVLFLDDDALPGASWLAAMHEALTRENVLAAGGPVEPIFSDPLPAWLDQRFLPYLSAWDLGREPVALHYNEYPRGANIGFRREAFERFGEFLPQLGRRGRSLRSCEEIELCLRLERAGAKVLYEPAAPVRHHVDTARLTPEWMAARFAAQGFSEALLEWRHAGLRGLRQGIRRARRNTMARRAGESPSESVLRLCTRRALRGYLAGALVAPVSVPRYRRDRQGHRVPPWQSPS